MARFVFLTKLNPSTMQWTICVKVFRSWQVKNCLDDVSRELILVDEEGSFGHATIPASLYGLPNFVMSENQSYVIEGFEVKEDKEQIQKTNLGYRIFFTDKTVINLASDPIICKPFNNVGFKRIYDNDFHGRWPYDIIIRVLRVGNLFEEVPPDKEWNELFVDLENIEDDRLSCRLPKPYANDFFNEWIHCVGDIICVIRFARIERNQDSIMVTTVHICTRVMINPPCPQVTQLRDAFDDLES
ncbi:PREDICTED: uncharacterized protein LOC104767926 [Camelina sativa]|uniref:Uncharacterized protein LOC104767926 n=1 Tax=Camelina sativa TaxID=90675 RepID=A0ABM0XS58_CAMSA|nr:PREDICTED: uncharacterized protein LOC104767926 [Camelina sativa]